MLIRFPANKTFPRKESRIANFKICMLTCVERHLSNTVTILGSKVYVGIKPEEVPHGMSLIGKLLGPKVKNQCMSQPVVYHNVYIYSRTVLWPQTNYARVVSMFYTHIIFLVLNFF
jgi:hypothetical protein